MFYFLPLAFSTLGIIGKMAYAEHVTVMSFLFWRSLISLIVFWSCLYFLFPRKEFLKIGSKNIKISMVAGIFGFYLASMFGLAGLLYIDPGVGAIVYSIYPIFVILLNAAIKKRIPPWQHIAVLFGTQVGLFLVVNGAGDINIIKQSILGVILELICAFCTAIYIIATQSVTQKLKSLDFIVYSITGGFIATAVHYIIFENISDLKVSFYGFILAVLSALFLSGSYLLLSKGIKVIGGSRSSLISSVSPLFAVLISYLVLGEVLNLPQIVGGAIIIISVLLLERKILVLIGRGKFLLK